MCVFVCKCACVHVCVRVCVYVCVCDCMYKGSLLLYSLCNTDSLWTSQMGPGFIASVIDAFLVVIVMFMAVYCLWKLKQLLQNVPRDRNY